MRIRILYIIIFILISLIIHAQDQNGFLSIDNQLIPDEFFVNYLDRQPDTVFISKNKKYLKELLNDYILFRIKIYEAEKNNLDTMYSFLKEYENFKNVYAASLLDYDQITDETTKEFYEHYCREVKISHIQVNLHPLPLPSDTLKAFNKIWEIYHLLQNGMEFETAARKYSENPLTVKEDGFIGYINASIVTYPLEYIAYKTPVGKYSKPIRTWQGYHIVKVLDTRESRGSILVTQIKKSIPSGAGDSLIIQLKYHMDSLLVLLNQGMNFNEMATEESDHESAADGGIMPWLRSGIMDEVFTETAFSLQHDGDISPVIRTKEGFHIIKRLRLEPVPPYNEMKEELIQNLQSNTSRSRYLRENLIGRIRAASNCQENEESVKEFFTYAATSFDKSYWKEPKGGDLNRILFTYGKDTIRQKDFSNYLALDRYPYRVRDYEIRIRQYYRDYLENKLMAFAEEYTEKVFPELNKELAIFRDEKLIEVLEQQKMLESSQNIEENLRIYFEHNRNNYTKGHSKDFLSYDEAFEKVLIDYNHETNRIWEKELKAKYDVNINKKAFKSLIKKVQESSGN